MRSLSTESPSGPWASVSRQRSQFGRQQRCPRPLPRERVRILASSGASQASQQRVASQHDLNARHVKVLQHYCDSLGVDDFMARVEVVLSGYGFKGDNSIAMTNLCRDEVTSLLKDKIESVFGSCFNTNGLGGVLTCGVTGMKAGLSHSPTSSSGRERYVFFSFPHIAIDSEGRVGSISRPGRAGRSCACGALQKCLDEFRAEGYTRNCRVPGVHDPLDPEYSILKQRLARRLRYEDADMSRLDLTTITATAERTMTNDLEYMIEKAVDPVKADYAVVTGIQVHNWAADLASGAPSLEFVSPTKVFVVVKGVKVHLDLGKVPSLSPRQLMLLATASSDSSHNGHGGSNGGSGIGGDASAVVSGVSSGSTLQTIPYTQLARRLGGAAFISPHKSMDEESLDAEISGTLVGANSSWPGWQSGVRTSPGSNDDRDLLAPTMDSMEDEGNGQNANTSFEFFTERPSPYDDSSTRSSNGAASTPNGAPSTPAETKEQRAAQAAHALSKHQSTVASGEGKHLSAAASGEGKHQSAAASDEGKQQVMAASGANGVGASPDEKKKRAPLWSSLLSPWALGGHLPDLDIND